MNFWLTLHWSSLSIEQVKKFWFSLSIKLMRSNCVLRSMTHVVGFAKTPGPGGHCYLISIVLGSEQYEQVLRSVLWFWHLDCPKKNADCKHTLWSNAVLEWALAQKGMCVTHTHTRIIKLNGWKNNQKGNDWLPKLQTICDWVTSCLTAWLPVWLDEI